MAKAKKSTKKVSKKEEAQLRVDAQLNSNRQILQFGGVIAAGITFLALIALHADGAI